MLSYGELSNLAMSGEGSGVIAENKKQQIISFANEALLRLHTKFILAERSLILELQEGQTLYQLTSQHAVQSFDPSVIGVPYIIDTPWNKFEDDLIRVLNVQNSWGQSRPLNDTKRVDSCFTPSFLVLQVPRTQLKEVISVGYQAKHKELTYTSEGEDSEITLSDPLHGALTAFIAHKVYQGMNTQESLAISQMHIAMFDSICNDAQEMDFLNTSISETNTRFNDRGWI